MARGRLAPGPSTMSNLNLKKVARDLVGEDEDIRILALTTVVQLTPAAIDDPADLALLREKLAAAVEAADPDTVFLARKGLNHVDDLLERTRGGTEAPAPAAPAEARVLGKAEALELLANETQDTHAIARALASLAQASPSADDLGSVLPLLSHEDARVRANAVEAVEATEDERLMVKELSGLLEDGNNRVRGNVTKALGRLGAPKVQETLEAMLASPNIAERESAVYSMGFLKGPAILDLLARGLQDRYEGVRIRAVRGLARHKDPRALPALREARNDIDIDVCEEADKAIRFLEMEAGQPVREGFAEVPGGELPGAAPAAPAPAAEVGDPPEGDLRSQRLREVVAVGQRVFELCRSGAMTEPALDRPFYDALKAREFLRKHQERQVQGAGDLDVQEAVQRLQQKILAAHRDLGELALRLVAEKKLAFDNAEEALRRVADLDARLRSAG